MKPQVLHMGRGLLFCNSARENQCFSFMKSGFSRFFCGRTSFSSREGFLHFTHQRKLLFPPHFAIFFPFFSNFLQNIVSIGCLAHLVSFKAPLSLCHYTTARIWKRKMGEKQGTTSRWQSKWMRKIHMIQMIQNEK